MKVKCIDNTLLWGIPFNKLEQDETYEVADTFKVYHMLNEYEFYVLEGIGNFLKYRFKEV